MGCDVQIQGSLLGSQREAAGLARAAFKASCRVSAKTPFPRSLADMNIDFAAASKSLPMASWHCSQQAVDATSVSPASRTHKTPGADVQPGRALLGAARRKQCQTCPEFVRTRRCRKVVVGLEVGGRFGAEAAAGLRLLSCHKTSSAPAHMRPTAQSAWVAPWSGLVLSAQGPDRKTLRQGKKHILTLMPRSSLRPAKAPPICISCFCGQLETLGRAVKKTNRNRQLLKDVASQFWGGASHANRGKNKFENLDHLSRLPRMPSPAASAQFADAIGRTNLPSNDIHRINHAKVKTRPLPARHPGLSRRTIHIRAMHTYAYACLVCQMVAPPVTGCRSVKKNKKANPNMNAKEKTCRKHAHAAHNHRVHIQLPDSNQ